MVYTIYYSFLKIYHDYLNKRIKLKKRAFTFIDIKNKISLLFFYYYKINLLKTSKNLIIIEDILKFLKD